MPPPSPPLCLHSTSRRGGGWWCTPRGGLSDVNLWRRSRPSVSSSPFRTRRVSSAALIYRLPDAERSRFVLFSRRFATHTHTALPRLDPIIQTNNRCNEILLIPVRFKCSEETRAKVERHVKGLTYRWGKVRRSNRPLPPPVLFASIIYYLCPATSIIPQSPVRPVSAPPPPVRNRLWTRRSIFAFSRPRRACMFCCCWCCCCSFLLLVVLTLLLVLLVLLVLLLLLLLLPSCPHL